MLADGGQLRGCVGGEVDLMVYDVLVGVLVLQTEEARVGAGAERDDLLESEGLGGGGEEAVDELVDGRGADVGSWGLFRVCLGRGWKGTYPGSAKVAVWWRAG